MSMPKRVRVGMAPETPALQVGYCRSASQRLTLR